MQFGGGREETRSWRMVQKIMVVYMKQIWPVEGSHIQTGHNASVYLSE